MALSTTIGLNIKIARADAGVTQRQLAEKVGVSPMTVSFWETGRNCPSLAHLIEVADALSVSLDQLVRNGATRWKLQWS